MARRSKSYEEQIESLNQQISKTQSKLDALIFQRDELLEKKKQEDLQELYILIKEHNLSIDDVSRMIEREELSKSA